VGLTGPQGPPGAQGPAGPGLTGTIPVLRAQRIELVDEEGLMFALLEVKDRHGRLNLFGDLGAGSVDQITVLTNVCLQVISGPTLEEVIVLGSIKGDAIFGMNSENSESGLTMRALSDGTTDFWIEDSGGFTRAFMGLVNRSTLVFVANPNTSIAALTASQGDVGVSVRDETGSIQRLSTR
jgi:hypothetical protein